MPRLVLEVEVPKAGETEKNSERDSESSNSLRLRGGEGSWGTGGKARTTPRLRGLVSGRKSGRMCITVEAAD